MNQDILLSKIVPNSTDTTWAQAYTTLNVYITLSIENEQSKTPVTTHGKDLLEKLQREFFALDDKSLDNIKNAVGNVSKTIGEEYKYSIIVGAIVSNILYIVIASEGQVVIRRGGKSGVIAHGIERQLHGFSGKLKHDDIVVLQTGDFAKKIPLNSLSEYLTTTDVSQIAENITPLIHEHSKGTEGAIILQYKDLSGTEKPEAEEFDLSEAEENEPVSKDDEKSYEHENLWTKPAHENRNIEELVDEKQQEYQDDEKKSRHLPKLPFPSINFRNKKILIAGAVLVLIAILIGGISIQSSRQNDQKREAEFGQIYEPAKKKFDEGASLATLNKTLALEDLSSASNMTKEALSKYKEGSSEYKKLTNLQSQIDEKISSLGGGGSAKNVKEFLKPNDDIKSITSITARAGELVILDGDGEKVVRVNTSGKLGKSYDIEAKDSYVASDDKFIYTMGSSVTRIDKGNGDVSVVLKEVNKGEAFDIFGSNLYVLEGSDILKYKAPSETSTSYFTDKPKFESKPTHMSISGSIWIVEENGTLSRFTKGVKDDFEVTGLQAPFSSGSLLYADPDISNIYVMDVKNQRVVKLTDKGEFQTQYEGSFIKNANSFAIDEENDVGYVLNNNVITSFDL
ncbi:MAG: hypothetical protein Q7T54_04955 [Candidatus Levybacteria bacterium]|nr:hypothetical protein [Candidatus Levybacteria bacterium]